MLQNRVAWVGYCTLLIITACSGGTSDNEAALAAVSDQDRAAIATLADSLVEAISKRASEDGFEGSVLVSRNGKTILHQTFRALSEKSGDAEPAYWIASCTKQFTGALIAVLVNDGLLDMDEPIETYLANVPKDKSRITLRQLLTHTSGLDQIYAAEGIIDREQATRRILQSKLISPPGAAYSYSNDGFTLAAIIGELVSGEPYEALMRSRLFEPAGLKHTGLWGFEGDEAIAPVRATAAVATQDKNIYSEGKSQANWGYRGATGMYATTSDLALWLSWLMKSGMDDSNPMSRVIARERLVREAPGLGTVYYGFGIAVIERDGALFMISHIGDDDWLGHSSTVTAFANGDIVVVLSNAGYLDDGTPWSAEISGDIRGLLKD